MTSHNPVREIFLPFLFILLIQLDMEHARTKGIGSLIRTGGESDVDSPINEEETENSPIASEDEHHEEKHDLQFISEMDSFIPKSMQSNEETRYFVFE